MTEFSEDEVKDPFHRAASLSALLSFHDIDFVRCAYVTVLGRQPDPSGQAHYLEQLRAGASKLEVLWRLRQSPEAKDHDPGIAGLDRALKRAAWQRRPLLGMISRLVRSDADCNSPNDRVLRALLNASSINEGYLQAINERLTAYSMQKALDACRPQESSPATGLGDGPAINDKGARVRACRSPELDHLRSKRVIKRYVDPGAP